MLESIGAAVYVLGTRRRRGDFQGTNQTPGIPDLYVVLPARGEIAARHLWIEVKTPGGRMRPAQQVFADLCESTGMSHVWGDLDNVVGFLERGGWLKAA